MSYFRVNHNCNGCLACVENCPASALRSEDNALFRTISHNMTSCARCGQCWRICPENAIAFQHLLEGDWDDVVTLALVRCRICEAPIHTEAFGKIMQKKLEGEFDALCPKHQQSHSVKMWRQLRPGQTTPNRK